MLGEGLKNYVDACTKGEVIDIVKLVGVLGGKVRQGPMPTVDKGELVAEKIQADEQTDNLSEYIFQLNQQNSLAENNTVLALLLAEYVIHANHASLLKEKYLLDVFFLRDLRNVRMSRQVILATRLALPETVIEQTGHINFDTAAYARKANLMPEFVSCAYSDVSVQGILGMFDSFHMGDMLR